MNYSIQIDAFAPSIYLYMRYIYYRFNIIIIDKLSEVQHKSYMYI